MSHDIYAENQKGYEIAYASYGMGNRNSDLLYRVLNANKYNAGVSGNGSDVYYSFDDLVNASQNIRKLQDNDFSVSDQDDLNYERAKIRQFINNCITIAENEGGVNIEFY